MDHLKVTGDGEVNGAPVRILNDATNISSQGKPELFLITLDEIFDWNDATIPPAGGKYLLLAGQLYDGQPFTLRVKYPANFQISPRWHPVTRHITVISGTYNIWFGDQMDKSKTKALPTGSFVTLPHHTIYYAWSNEETILQIHGVGPYAATYLP